MGDFSKRYDFSFEEEIYNLWEEKWYFNPEKLEEIKWKLNWRFVISMPPPNVTWVLHIWHALMLAIEDAMVRYARMKWKKTLWIPWTDHAWIATQVVVEKKLAKEEWKTRHDLGREKFLEKVWEWVRFSRNTIISQIKKMGASCDWTREQFTLSESLSRAVRKSFSNLYSQWKIYQWEYIVNWCPRCQTVLSDIEVKYEKEKWKLYYIRYFVVWKWEAITVATTRPETMFADVAIAVNPKDKRYKKYIWKQVYIPIVNRPIPVIADEEVDPYFGTWALKITPAHDPDDFHIAQKHNLPMDLFAIDKKWNFTDLAPEVLRWKPVEKVFNNLIQILEEIWNLEKVEDYEHNVPRCDRCKTVIQPMISKQWFVDVKEFAQKSIEAVRNWDTKILPERFNKTFFDWLENIRPWCISRQLRWGHRIPVRTCSKGHINVFDDYKIFDNWKKEKKWYIILPMIVFNLISDSRLENPFNVESLVKILTTKSLTPQKWRVIDVYLEIYKNFINQLEDDNLKAKLEDEIKLLEEIFDFDHIDINKSSKLVDMLEDWYSIVNHGDKYKLVLKCEKCWDTHLVQDEDVLDTWFSSALWPFSILGWPEKTKDLELYYPNDVLETGYDILFFRVARMMMMWFANMNERPFNWVYLHWLVRDEKWEKMSKSKWNVVDPLDIIEKYWADSLRLTLVRGVTPWNDVKFSESKLAWNRNFLNKIWNASRYVYTKLNLKDISEIDYDLLYEDISNHLDQLNDFDKWILYQLNILIEEVEKLMEKFMLGEAINKIVDFAWTKYCDWYIEISKIKYSDWTEKVLLYTIWTILKLLHPFAPFITEKLWHLLKFRGDLIIQDYPKPIKDVPQNVNVNILTEVISAFRNLRTKVGLKPHESCDILISGNEDFLDLVKNYEDLLKSILKADNLYYREDGADIEDDWTVGVVYNIKLGLKWKKQLSRKEQILLLEKQLKEEEQFLQSLRNTLSNPQFLQNAPKHIVEAKKKKMKEVEDKILKIKVELNKLKMKW